LQAAPLVLLLRHGRPHPRARGQRLARRRSRLRAILLASPPPYRLRPDSQRRRL